MKTVILTNVGTPQSTSPEDVGIYLREFLMDENIIQIPRPIRDLLVKGIIVPKRKFSSAEKYKKIWTEQGSPLMVESKRLQENLQSDLGADWRVLIAMQVGQPSIESAFNRALAESSEIYFCPLYPQFATATTGGAMKAASRLAPPKVTLRTLKPFYSETWFIQAQAQVIRKSLKPGDHLLLSFHGLPVSQLKKHNPSCDISKGDSEGSGECCHVESACFKNCYKAQCLKTADLIQKELNWKESTVGFQSRLGRSRWIEPSTEQVVDGLLKQGVNNLKVACPSFVADCLETLEEIGLELRQKFMQGGGQSFELIPCVNSHPTFTKGLGNTLLEMAKKAHIERVKS